MITDVVVRPAAGKGNGVFALRAFRKGEFIFRRRHGPVVSNAAIRSLDPKDRRHLCELDFQTSAILLAPGCYLNHSCDPNAMRSGVKVFGRDASAVAFAAAARSSAISSALKARDRSAISRTRQPSSSASTGVGRHLAVARMNRRHEERHRLIERRGDAAHLALAKDRAVDRVDLRRAPCFHVLQHR